MKNKEFKEFMKDIDCKTMINICHQYFNDNPRYVAIFSEDQIEEILDCMLNTKAEE